MSSKSTKTLQRQIDDLAILINWFDQEDFDIEQALTKCKEAEKLADKIRLQLTQLNNEITVLKERFEERQ